MNATKQKKVGATPVQLALVGVLAVVLAGVLWSNFGEGGEVARAFVASAGDAPAEEPAAAAPKVAASADPAAKSTLPARALSPFGEFSSDGDWTHVALDEVVRFDPFAEPKWLTVGATPTEGAQAEAAEQSIEQLQQATNAIIFVSGEERVALIGTQQYRIGDMIGQYQVTDISSAGIVLSPPSGEAPTVD